MSSRQKLIPVGISNRHFHIAQSDLEILFGAGHQLHNLRDISQKGQFAADETIDVQGPKGRIKSIRIVGPPRGQTQLEISRTDAYHLGIDPPVRYSGDLSGSAGGRLIGPKGEIVLNEGIIIPQRHIHMNPGDAQRFAVKDRDRVFVAPLPEPTVDPGCEPRSIIFANVLIRVDETFVLDFHIDTDEANASGLKTGDQVYIVRMDVKAQPVRNRKLITEHDVQQAIRQRKRIIVPEGALITPAAAELAKAHDIFANR